MKTDLAIPHPVMTVRGPVPFDALGITDAHNHVWIERIPGADAGSPALDQFDAIARELTEYFKQGGRMLLDCQPGGCGRDGNQLFALSAATGVHLVACTGFHRRRYYGPDYWLWSADAQTICDALRGELEQGLAETLNAPHPVRAGFIKVALEATWAECPRAALEGAARAAVASGALIEVHTEKGALAEEVCAYFTEAGVSPAQIVLCHMDKRPDIGLHRELARFGALLEYDTFYRPKYDPAANLWPLIEKMVSSGHANRLALATDMAETALYRAFGGPGLASLPGEVRDQLIARGFSPADVAQMVGGNIARQLAGIQ